MPAKRSAAANIPSTRSPVARSLWVSLPPCGPLGRDVGLDPEPGVLLKSSWSSQIMPVAGASLHSPASLFAGHLSVLAVVLVWVLDRCHAVHGRGALELNVLPGAWSHRRRVLLEDALRRTAVRVGIGRHLQ